MNTAVQWVALLVSVGAGALAGALVVRRARTRSRDDRAEVVLGDVARGALFGRCVVIGVAALGVTLSRVDVFGLFGFGYFAVVVGVPVAAVPMVLWVAKDRAARGLSGPVMAVTMVAVLCGCAGFWASRVEPYRIYVDRPDPVIVAGARTGDDTIRIGVLTDLQTTHVGDHERRAVDLLMAEHPDLILVPGDLYQGSALREELPALRELLSRLDAPGGVFLVPGDTDAFWTAGLTDGLDEMTRGTRVRVLRDEVVVTQVKDRTVRIAGLRLDYLSPLAAGAVATLEAAPGDGDIRILLSHRPDSVYHLGNQPRTDLVVAGHTHGGQISIPGIGPLITLSGVPRMVGAGGLFTLDGRRIYVGHGVGMERGQAPPVRFGVPPNVTVLTLSS